MSAKAGKRCWLLSPDVVSHLWWVLGCELQSSVRVYDRLQTTEPFLQPHQPELQVVFWNQDAVFIKFTGKALIRYHTLLSVYIKTKIAHPHPVFLCLPYRFNINQGG